MSLRRSSDPEFVWENVVHITNMCAEQTVTWAFCLTFVEDLNFVDPARANGTDYDGLGYDNYYDGIYYYYDYEDYEPVEP